MNLSSGAFRGIIPASFNRWQRRQDALPPAAEARQHRGGSRAAGHCRQQVPPGEQRVPLPAVLRGDDDDHDNRKWGDRLDAPARVPACDGPEQRQPAPRRHDAEAAQRQLRKSVLQPETVNSALKNKFFPDNFFRGVKKKPCSEGWLMLKL